MTSTSTFMTNTFSEKQKDQKEASMAVHSCKGTRKGIGISTIQMHLLQQTIRDAPFGESLQVDSLNDTSFSRNPFVLLLSVRTNFLGLSFVMRYTYNVILQMAPQFHGCPSSRYKVDSCGFFGEEGDSLFIGGIQYLSIPQSISRSGLQKRWQNIFQILQQALTVPRLRVQDGTQVVISLLLEEG